MASARNIHGFTCCEGRFLKRITGFRRLVCVLGGGVRPPARPGRGREDQAVAVYITTASCPSTGAVACLAGHRVWLNHSATSSSGPIMRMRPLANGNTPSVPGRPARRAAPCLRCGPCVRGARPGDGRCRGAGQRFLGSYPAIAALRGGESVAAARGSPGGVPVGARAAVSGGVGVWIGEPWSGSHLSGARRAAQWAAAQTGAAWADTGATAPTIYANIII
jgi:hypothetical protein